MDGDANNMAKRDTSTFKSNFTASLQIWHKNVIANNQSVLLNVAQTLASATYNNAISPAFSFALSSVASQMASPSTSSPSTSTKQNKKASKQEVKARQQAAEAQSIELREKLDALEAQIKPILKQKSDINEIENANKAKKKKPYLTEKQQAKRNNLLNQIDDLLVQKVELCLGLIEEHVMRRLDLTFLLMVAVYKQRITLSKGSTDRQHGRGQNGNAACHASLIPHPIIEPITVSPSYFENPLKRYTAYQLFFGCEPQKHLLDEDKLKHCYLYDILNMTTELPKIVNDFDGHMEGKWVESNAVKSLIQIINQVSMGEINPIEGINRYADIMYLFFNHMGYKLLNIESSKNSPEAPKAFALIKEYQYRGTFAMFSRTDNKDGTSSHQIDGNYIYHMLKLNDFTLPSITKNIPLFLEQKILDIQQDIWQQPSTYTEHLETKSHHSPG